ncbi:MAG TPA: protein kinase [Kofleriaceae bacterium]|nr:protein kinase [Kofleriaceae bacterium]
MKKPTPFGKYYLLERINVGGMAEVFRAKAFGVEGFERLVAVKRILPNIAEDKEFIRMFIEEAKLAVQLNHANIAQIFDLGVVDGAYYIALEHVHGRDLRAMFDRCRQIGEAMPVSQACFCVMKVCEGLDYAHNKRDQGGRELHLVHRDVSPQNVLVSFEGEVKLIDFGIAKAAGKGSKTQAGILKGKFGYMSPEQVRGIPIDRRSDVFSCGIVLYELLTGERLFVGESDFSTLEKVRNVEILPPSTYNRRIPDELERIVLKALAKDPDERYSNAIDLHDELQAFVYTAGEFYSRKDLAGWMKKTFGREIEEETAKLESYRQLKAPVAPVDEGRATNPVLGRTPTGSRPPTAAASPSARKSQPSGPQKTMPPPPPARPSGEFRAIQNTPGPQAVTSPVKKQKRGPDDEGLAWDDDELETQIYDNPEDKAAAADVRRQAKQSGSHSANLPLSSPPATPVPAPAAAAPPPPPPPPDLASLAGSTLKGWEKANGNGNGASPPAPMSIASGSNKGPAPKPPVEDPLAALAASYSAAPSSSPFAAPPSAASARDLPMPKLTPPDPLFDPMASFGSGIVGRKRTSPSGSKNTLFIAIGGAAVAVVAVVVIIAMTGSKKDGPKSASAGTDSTQTTPTVNQAPTTAVDDPNTGFDLYVNPPGTMTWRLDGEERTTRLPSRVRGITPGVHTVAIDAPAGYLSQNQSVTVEAGKAPRVDIMLQPIDISGTFSSDPAGATVSLIVDGKRETLGPSPAKTKLDPRKTYQVLFEKTGYVSVNKPIVFTGSADEPISVVLEKAGAVAAVATQTPKTETKTETQTQVKVQTPKTNTGGTPVTRPDTKTETKVETPKTETKTETKTEAKVETPKVETPKAEAKGEGTLLLGSKPPCDIFIDGKATGLQTPQRDIKLTSGKHKITLVNNEFGIKETFSVEIKPDAVEKQIKDYSDRIPK